jgi:hypothetical protein
MTSRPHRRAAQAELSPRARCIRRQPYRRVAQRRQLVGDLAGKPRGGDVALPPERVLTGIPVDRTAARRRVIVEDLADIP